MVIQSLSGAITAAIFRLRLQTAERISPAGEAGLLNGDTLMLFNAKSMREFGHQNISGGMQNEDALAESSRETRRGRRTHPVVTALTFTALTGAAFAAFPTAASAATINEMESNNSIATANTISGSPTTVNGSISSPSDTDYFKVTLQAGKTLTVTMTPTSSSSDFDLYLKNSVGTTLCASEKAGNVTDTCTYKNNTAGPITLYAQTLRYAGAGAYTEVFTM
ncbi:PPC domain-containing protein [Kitasatospora sp. MBT63]|uniref:PPC domain-containing protein n=1 Tax=Kitasatospora sp. MBT63 TaxID=1444768 RepID=UPI0009E8A3A9|nr:PPC domain-containing protein [Kitasatospora sp. MBT63]